jgi:hypothetical protein
MTCRRFPNPIEPLFAPQYGYLDPNRYADQGIVIHGRPSQIVVSRPAEAVSPPNVYQADFGASPDFPPGAFREITDVSFTRGSQPALTSAFGTFFIGNIDEQPLSTGSISGLAIGGGEFIPYRAALTPPGGSTFLGLATVDSATGQLVPAISEITVNAGSHGLGPEPDLDNFTFASPVARTYHRLTRFGKNNVLSRTEYPSTPNSCSSKRHRKAAE